MAGNRRPAPPPPPQPLSSTDEDEGSSSSDEEQEYVFQPKPPAVPKTTPSSSEEEEESSSEEEDEEEDEGEKGKAEEEEKPNSSEEEVEEEEEEDGVELPVKAEVEGELPVKAEVKESDGAVKNSIKFPYLSHAIQQMDKGNATGHALKRSFERMDPGKAAILEEKVKALQIKKMRHRLREMDLIRRSVELVVDSLAANK